MEFIEANYMWIMIVIIVFTITLIGYIADKSNLIRPNKKKKDNKNKEDLFDKINSSKLDKFDELLNADPDDVEDDSEIKKFDPEADDIKEEYSDLVFIELVHLNGYTSDNQYIYMSDYNNVQFIPDVPNISKVEISFV